MRLLALFLLCTLPANAKPHPRLRHVAEITYNLILPAATSLISTKKISDCRKEFGIGPCPQGGYGAYTARQGVTFSLSLGEGILSHFWHKDCECKESFLPSTGMIVFNTATAIAAARHKGPKETN